MSEKYLLWVGVAVVAYLYYKQQQAATATIPTTSQTAAGFGGAIL